MAMGGDSVDRLVEGSHDVAFHIETSLHIADWHGFNLISYSFDIVPRGQYKALEDILHLFFFLSHLAG